MASVARLLTTRDGTVLCPQHARTGAPIFHTPGCSACEAARAKGIQRPDIGTVLPKRRGSMALHRGYVNWDRVRAARARNGAA